MGFSFKEMCNSNATKKKTIISLVVTAMLFLGASPFAAAHGSDEMQSTHHGGFTIDEKVLPSGLGLPAGVTRVIYDKRYQWTGSFWRLMSEKTW